MNQPRVYKIKDALKIIGCIKSDRWLLALLKQVGVLDKERGVLPPYKYEGNLITETEEVCMGKYKKIVPVTKVTKDGLNWLRGVILIAGKTTKTARSGNHQHEYQGKTPGRTGTDT